MFSIIFVISILVLEIKSIFNFLYEILRKKNFKTIENIK